MEDSRTTGQVETWQPERGTRERESKSRERLKTMWIYLVPVIARLDELPEDRFKYRHISHTDVTV